MHLLLVLDDFADLLAEVLELGFLGLSLLQFCDLVAELLLGLREGFDGCLLGGGRFLLLREGVLGLLHLLGGFGE